MRPGGPVGIEIVVPFPHGGGTNDMMRMITPIIEENEMVAPADQRHNRVGGSGTISYSYLITKKALRTSSPAPRR